jgi:hypothetical protein
MSVADTSLEAYREHRQSGELGAQQRKVMLFFHLKGGEHTRSELAEKIPMRLSSVCGRVNELIKLGYLVECERRPCAGDWHQRAPGEVAAAAAGTRRLKPTTIRIDRCPRCGTTLRERTTEKNAHLHAVLGAISKQRQWAEKWLDIEAWKRLIVSAYERAHGRTAEIYPALDGQGFDVVYRRTSRMSQEEIRDLIDFAESWAIDNGVELAPLEAA